MAALATGCAAPRPSAPAARPLFDGRTLEGWRVAGLGAATFTVEGDAIVGIVGPGPNTFLRTERLFRDFVLELEFRWDVPGNSGIQFRSQELADGRVVGYQCELDPSDRAWTGGIYDEGRRGWLIDLADDAVAREAVRIEGWNRVRIEARGTRLRTWINGVPCADLEDDVDAEGFVALQVHSGAEGRIRWRNIRVTERPAGAAE